MPKIYLSPSAQAGNPYITGGNEEYYMNLIADAMEPYLQSSGIAYTRNDPSQTAIQFIAQSNAGNYDLHLAIHSNAAPDNRSGQVQGSDVYYYLASVWGMRAAQIFADNLKKIYPHPEKVRTLSTFSIGEVSRVRSPAVFLELAYHDNVEDATWIKENIDSIARNLVLSLTQYFGIPFVEPMVPREGIVITQSGGLNIRRLPSDASQILATAPRGSRLIVYGKTGNWHVVKYANVIGYASAPYIQLL